MAQRRTAMSWALGPALSRATPSATACVYLPALALQIAHRCEDLTSTTCGVVCDGAFIAWPNRAAKHAGVRQGMRLAQARSLVPMLQTATVSAAQEKQATQEIWQHLLQFSPAIEPDAQHLGLFWLDPNGLQHLFGTHVQWSEAIHQHLRERQYHATVVVGFNRYLAYTIACRHRVRFVCEDAASEMAIAYPMPLSQVPLPADVRKALLLLGVATLGDFLRMPIDEVRQCLGLEAESIHRLAHNQIWAPLTPKKWVAPHEVEQTLETPDDNVHRLLFAIRSMLQPMLDKLQRGCQACTGVHLQLRIDSKQSMYEHIAPAMPTLEERKLTELIRLRLTTMVLLQPVTCITVRIESRVMRPEQMSMLQHKPQRDLRAAACALAKVRALMGEHAVTYASLCDSHLPELSFRWDLLSQVVLPQVPHAAKAAFAMIRSVRPTHALLPPPPQRNIRQWLRRDGHIESMHGPYRMHSGWWRRAMERDYYYIQTDQQKIIWVYYSRLENRWFRQGHMD